MSKKSYRKWIHDIMTYWGKHRTVIRRMPKSEQERLLTKMLLTAFGFSHIEGIHKIYPKWDKSNITKVKLIERFHPFLKEDLYKIIVGDWHGKRRTKKKNQRYKNYNREEEDEDEDFNDVYEYKHFIKRNMTFLDYLNDDKMDKLKKLEVLDEALEYIPKCRYNLIPIKGDPVTFIGSTFMKVGDTQPYLNHGVCLGDCHQITMEHSRCEIESYSNEKELLLAWTEMIRREKPDVIIGYNIFGFDWKFLCERAEETKCFEHFIQLSRNNDYKCVKKKKIIRIASGTHELTYIDIDGIIQIDLYNYFRREVNLPSYKLQDVGSHFIGDMVKKVEHKNGKTRIYSSNLMGLQVGNYVCFELIGHSSDSYQDGKKFKVLALDYDNTHYDVAGIIEIEEGKKLRWGLGKDDISVADLFKAFSDIGTKEDRTKIGKYCFQDCNLVHHLFRKNDIWTGMVEQAAICSIPIDYVVMRGQGIKLLSFIAKKCRIKKTLMPVIEKVENDGSYEGAICLKPKRGFYGDKDPVAVVDYASLYPSSMISENISHDSKVWTVEYDLEGNELRHTGIQDKSGNFIYDNLPDYEYVDIEYDRYEWISPDGKKKEVKVKVGTKKCRFAQFPDGKKAIMPAILQGLLAARKATRVKGKYKTILTRDGKEFSGLLSEEDTTYTITDVRLENEQLKKIPTVIDKTNVELIKDTYNSFMKNVFNQRQGAIKIVANSLYGQCGGRTSSFYEKDIAASTTSTGRKLLLYAQRVIEEVYGDCECSTKKYGKVHCNAEYVYGDTDSVFFTFHLKELDGTPIVGKKGLEITIELAQEAGQLASTFLKPPHDLEYEKTFFPFLLLSKKRYVGLLYETNIEKCKRKSMGIVLKRRDNAPIVKDGYGGIIDILMNEHNIGKAVKFIKNFLHYMVNEKFPLEKLIISKALRGFYKNPEGIAHRVLADRMGQRDPGNKPAVGSRIPYVFIQTKKKVRLQGNRIEHPDYIRANNINPD
ncbi:MAG: DNA polymerase domain-containing protein [Candidatus Neomarinimicrobiota bacterium]